jgi:hypothetical protein
MTDEVYTKQGVRNLDVMLSDKHREAVRAREEAERRRKEAEAQERMGRFGEIVDIHDLLYDDNQELREEILSVWPEAQLNGTYDDIHENRLEVDLRTSELAWIKWLVRNGWAAISFRFQLYLQDNDKEKHALLEMAMDQEAPGWRKKKRK